MCVCIETHTHAVLCEYFSLWIFNNFYMYTDLKELSPLKMSDGSSVNLLMERTSVLWGGGERQCEAHTRRYRSTLMHVSEGIFT